MLFLRAFVALFAYDVLSKSCSFKAIYAVVKQWTVADSNGLLGSR